VEGSVFNDGIREGERVSKKGAPDMTSPDMIGGLMPDSGGVRQNEKPGGISHEHYRVYLPAI
jgi:hypothetical protein